MKGGILNSKALRTFKMMKEDVYRYLEHQPMMTNLSSSQHRTSTRVTSLWKFIHLPAIAAAFVLLASSVTLTFAQGETGEVQGGGIRRKNRIPLSRYIQRGNQNYSYTIFVDQPTPAPATDDGNEVGEEYIIEKQNQEQENATTLNENSFAIETSTTTGTTGTPKQGRFPICPLDCPDGYKLLPNSILKLPTVTVPCENIFYAASNGFLSRENCNFLFELQFQQSTCQCVSNDSVRNNTTIDDDQFGFKSIQNITDNDIETINPTTSISSNQPSSVPTTQPSSVPTTQPTSFSMYPKCIICENSDATNDIFDHNSVVALPDEDKTSVACGDAIEAGRAGVLSLSNCMYLNSLMSEQGVCGCAKQVVSDRPSQLPSDSPSQIPSDSPSTGPSSAPVSPPRRISKIWDGRFAPSNTPSAAPSSDILEAPPALIALLQRSSPRNITNLLDGRFRWLQYFRNTTNTSTATIASIADDG
jgi:hypothetical protein